MLSNLVAENKRLAMDGIHQLDSQIKSVQGSIIQFQQALQDSKPAVERSLQNLRLQSLDVTPILPQEPGDLQNLSNGLSVLAHAVSVTASDHQLLGSLWFKALGERKANVAKSYKDTFSWVLNPESPTKFEPWLRRENGVYWIMGKAGSGKSTLMKFLLNHPKTIEALKSWAEGKELVVTSFFLWHAGIALQKSQEGLFRSLLYEILRQCPDLIQPVCASKAQTFRPYGNDLLPWNIQELRQTLGKLKEQSGTRIRFCFFIDGLDEYDGEPDQIVEVLESLAKWEDLKLCVSSRPWNEFIDAFGRPDDPQLALENLTREDITLYVQETLVQNSRFRNLALEDLRSEDLLQEILEKARGVFLWVVLVVRSLLTGLRNADRISDLQRRLQDFPPTLEEYFNHILNSIEPIYRRQTAEAFKFALEARKPLSLTTYSLLDEEDLEKTLSKYRNGITTEALLSRHNDMRRRLNGRSKGLLEVMSGSASGVRSPPSEFFFPTVDFLHRTAHDFLLSPGMQLNLKENLGPNFQVNMRLFEVFYAQTQLMPRRPKGTPKELFVDLAFYASELERDRCYDHFLRLNNLIASEAPDICVLTFLVHERNYQYITELLTRRPALASSNRIQLLCSLLGTTGLDYLDVVYPILDYDPAMISILLKSGTSPNAKHGRSTIWGGFLQQLHRNKIQASDDDSLLRTIELLLCYGADLGLEVEIGQTTITPKATGRAADLHKRNNVRIEYLPAKNIIMTVLGTERASQVFSKWRPDKRSSTFRRIWGNVKHTYSETSSRM